MTIEESANRERVLGCVLLYDEAVQVFLHILRLHGEGADGIELAAAILGLLLLVLLLRRAERGIIRMVVIPIVIVLYVHDNNDTTNHTSTNSKLRGPP